MWVSVQRGVPGRSLLNKFRQEIIVTLTRVVATEVENRE